MFNTPKDS